MKKTVGVLGILILTAVLSLSSTGSARAEEGVGLSRKGAEIYRQVVQKTAAMVSDSEARRIISKNGLNLINLTWEDTGRYKGSCVGPNISDMTIQIQQKEPGTGRYFLTCMPVIRYANFSDKTGDISPDRFYLLVGNEKGKSLRRITLREYLGNLRKYLSKPSSWKGEEESLLAKRDSHVLVSAQACFLPVPKQGLAEFNAVLFNYQSYEGDPAVLAILATREGTSATIIDNKRDAFQAGRTWGQRLFFNQDGERASLTGKRMSDYLAGKKGEAKSGQVPETDESEVKGLNMVLLIQVPLKQKRPMRFSAPEACLSAGANADMMKCEKKAQSDVEAAVIGHGKVEGPFTEIAGLPIERDPNFPIRVTVQFYKATSNGVVSAEDISEIKKQIDLVYNEADYVGSLVTEGETGRPTEYTGDKVEPPGWWEAFWKRYYMNTDQTKEEAQEMLRRLLGPTWPSRPKEEIKKVLETRKK